MKLKSMILAMFLTLGMTFSYANGSVNNLHVNEPVSTFTNLVEKLDLSKELTSTEVTYFTIEEDCKWTKYVRVTTISHFFLGYHVGSTVTSEFIWKCV